MGLEDREYLREEARRYGGGGGLFGGDRGDYGSMRMVTRLVIVCLVLYLADAFTPPVRVALDEAGQRTFIVSNTLFDWMALRADDVFSANILTAPWNLYQLLSYGFAHASMTTERSFFHIFFNMLVLWMLGRLVEDRMGRYEFLYFYLVAIVFSGLFWGLFNAGTGAVVIGASGAVTGVVLLFAFYFPYEKVYLFGILEIPGWLVGVLVVGQDILLALSSGTDRVAYEAHLGGAAFAAIYFYSRIRLENWVPTEWFSRLRDRRPRLRVHDPQQRSSRGDDDSFVKDQQLADDILEKLHREGEASLTRKERKILERYSKRLRKRNEL